MKHVLITLLCALLLTAGLAPATTAQAAGKNGACNAQHPCPTPLPANLAPNPASGDCVANHGQEVSGQHKNGNGPPDKGRTCTGAPTQQQPTPPPRCLPCAHPSPTPPQRTPPTLVPTPQPQTTPVAPSCTPCHRAPPRHKRHPKHRHHPIHRHPRHGLPPGPPTISTPTACTQLIDTPQGLICTCKIKGQVAVILLRGVHKPKHRKPIACPPRHRRHHP